MASGPARRSSRLLGKAQDWHKAYQEWCVINFLLISSKTDKETFARCLSISGHGRVKRRGGNGTQFTIAILLSHYKQAMIP